jgi:hypothetical protein
MIAGVVASPVDEGGGNSKLDAAAREHEIAANKRKNRWFAIRFAALLPVDIGVFLIVDFRDRSRP